MRNIGPLTTPVKPIRESRKKPIAAGVSRVLGCTKKCAFSDPPRQTGQDPGDCLGIGNVLLLQDAGGEAFRVVARQDRNPSLQHDRPRIRALIHDVDRAAGFDVSRLERPPLRLETGVPRQERRVDVQDASRIAIDETGREDSHISGQADQIRTNPRPERRIASRQRRPVILRSEATKNLLSGAVEKILRCAQDESAPGAGSTTTRRLPGTTFPISKKR